MIELFPTDKLISFSASLQIQKLKLWFVFVCMPFVRNVANVLMVFSKFFLFSIQYSEYTLEGNTHTHTQTQSCMASNFKLDLMTLFSGNQSKELDKLSKTMRRWLFHFHSVHLNLHVGKKRGRRLKNTRRVFVRKLVLIGFRFILTLNYRHPNTNWFQKFGCWICDVNEAISIMFFSFQTDISHHLIKKCKKE